MFVYCWNFIIVNEKLGSIVGNKTPFMFVNFIACQITFLRITQVPKEPKLPNGQN